MRIGNQGFAMMSLNGHMRNKKPHRFDVAQAGAAGFEPTSSILEIDSLAS